MVRAETDSIIAFMNELLELDRDCLSALVGYRVECNQALADHPSVQVGPVIDKENLYDVALRRKLTGKAKKSPPMVCGLLGILNGYCGVIDGTFCGPIAAVLDDSDKSKIVKFVRVEKSLSTSATETPPARP